MLTDPRAGAVVRAVVDLAHVLGVTIVAEGVENRETADKLREFGCDVAQGFYYSRPLNGEATFEMLCAQTASLARSINWSASATRSN